MKDNDKMKKQLLYTEVTKAAEIIAQALRKYSGESLYCDVTVFSREPDEEGEPDLYAIRIHENADEFKNIIGEMGLIIRDEDGKIARIEYIHRGDIA